MILKIEWDKIKDGFKGFENLAFEYVKQNYSNPTWEKTSLTRDGNKDATAIFFGYKNEDEEKWWMEAKYSNSVSNLSRYRLDATIVSAILEKNIGKVIFVTNTIISAKTIYDIRKALYNAINCNDVIFCTKYTLEYWISQKIDLYQRYFDVICNKKDTINLPNLFIIQEIEYFSEVSNTFAFKEPLRELYTNEKYIGYFLVFSSQKVKLPFRAAKDAYEINIIDSDYYILMPGENTIKFTFIIEKCKYDITNKPKVPSFLLGNQEVLSARYIIPTSKDRLLLNLSSQKKVLKVLENKYRNFNINKEANYIFIEGISGSGKSYILENFVKESISPQKEIFYAEFTDSPQGNIQILINLILFLLFPYLNPNEIDYEYLAKIKNNFVGDSIITLVAKRNEFDMISQIMSKYHITDNLMPSKMYINERVIILDDLQKLLPYQANFLAVIIADMQRHNLSVFAIMSGQPSYFTDISYIVLLEHCVIEHYYYSIGLNDIFSSIPKEHSQKVYLNQDITYSLEFSVIEIFLFSKYILENEIFSNNIQEFITTCKIFQRSAFLEIYIIKQFKNFFNKYPTCRKICDSIYWSSGPRGIDKYKNSENEINLLFSNGFIKYNYDSCLVPEHDIYKLYYCKHYKNTSFNEQEYADNSPELIKFRLENEINLSLLSKETDKIMNLANRQKFYTVSYVLQDIFETAKGHALKNRIDRISYYKLYYAYALSTTQQSTSKTGFDIFLELSKEIDNIDIPSIIEISISVNWELALGNYERLRYEEALNRLKLVIISTKKLCHFNNIDIHKSIRYHDVLMLDTLIRANRNENVHNLYKMRISIIEKWNFIYRSKSFQVRYALTLCSKNIEMCLQILQECNEYFKANYGIEDKYFLWSAYHFNYFFMIYNKSPHLIDNVIIYHAKLKTNFYANYRSRLNGIAAYYYYKGEITLGNKYLFLEAAFDNELPDRQMAFQFETVALHEVLINNIDEAIQALRQAIALFKDLPVYQDLPIHNLQLLESGEKIYQLDYWFGNSLHENIYYIDSRCSW